MLFGPHSRNLSFIKYLQKADRILQVSKWNTPFLLYINEHLFQVCPLVHASKQTNAIKSCLICHTPSFSWHSVSHVCPTYQTMGWGFLMTSAEAEEAKGKWVGLMPAATISKVARSGTIWFTCPADQTRHRAALSRGWPYCYLMFWLLEVIKCAAQAAFSSPW